MQVSKVIKKTNSNKAGSVTEMQLNDLEAEIDKLIVQTSEMRAALMKLSALVSVMKENL